MSPSRILVAQSAFLGDVVLATPLAAAVRQLFPECRITFLSTPAGCELLEGLPGVDRVAAFDKRKSERGFRGLHKKAAELKEMNFDLALSAHRSLRTAALLYLAAIPRRIGFATTPVPWLYNELVDWDPGRHEVLRNLDLLGPLGGAPAGYDPVPRLPDFGPLDDGLLAGEGQGPRIGICPGSVWPTKRWRPDGFARVAEGLVEGEKARVYLIGSPEDEEAAAEVASECRVSVHNLVGKTGLRDWVRTIKAMDLVITNDSAPTHIAAAAGTPVVVVYGPTVPSQGFAPWGVDSAVVEVPDLRCRPCGRHGSRRCPEGHFQCMEYLDAGRVLEAARGLLAGVR
jgi:heptosyltransferase-2